MSIMDPLVDDRILSDVFERDCFGGIDNAGIDIRDLDNYINNDDNNDNTMYFGDLPAVGDIKGLGNATPRDSPSRHLHNHHNLHHHSSLHPHSTKTQAFLTSGGLPSRVSSSSSSSPSSSSSFPSSGLTCNLNGGGGGGGVGGIGGGGGGGGSGYIGGKDVSSMYDTTLRAGDLSTLRAGDVSLQVAVESNPGGYAIPYQRQNSSSYGHHLPDSPPDSGSEPPYSPPDHPNLSPLQKPGGVGDLYQSPNGAGAGSMMAFPYPVMQTQQQQQQPQQQQQQQQQIQQQQPIQHPTTQTHNPVHNPTHNPTHVPLQTHNTNSLAYQQQVILGNGNLVGPSLPATSPSAYGPPPGNQVPTIGGVAPSSTSPVGGGGGGGGGSLPSGKKRKMNDSGGLANVVYIKEEPDQSITHHLGPHTSVTTYCEEDEYTMDSNNGPYMDSSYQCIKFHNFQQTNWSVICDSGLKELNLQTFRVDADKGFNFSNPDDAFVCQKKNHFQVTVHIQTTAEPIFVKSPDGLQKIERFYVHFFGVKTESPSQVIRVEQSQSDRTKKAFHPVPVELKPEQIGKITVGRLHFSETTSNNMRKKGKPNPDQRYFYLVVALKAHCGDNSYTVAAQASEKIIVRASNPGQFESDVEYTFQRGTYPESIYHMGRVGVNTDRPDEALVINGNLKVTGQFLQPSDKRAKKDVAELDTREQLKNVSNLRVVTYSYKKEFAETAGMKKDELFDTGVIAQEVKEVIPDAVKTTGDYTLSNGDKINNFLLVNKDRIYMENVGAVKELCKVTGNLENRIGELEKMNKKIAQLKRMESFKSTTSSVSTRTSGTSRMSSVSAKGRGCSGRRHKQLGGGRNHDEGICNNKTLQLTTITLVCIMAFCLMAMATIYILDYQGRIDPTTPLMTATTMATTTIVLSSSMATSTNTPFYTTDITSSSTDDGSLTSLVFTTKPTYGTTPGDSSTTALPTPPTPEPPIIGRPENCQETTPGDEPICDVYCCLANSDSFANLLSPVFSSPPMSATAITFSRRIPRIGHTTLPSTMSRYSEVFTNKLSTSDPNTVNDSTTQAGMHFKPIPSKKSLPHAAYDRLSRHRPRMNRPSNSRSIKQTLSKRSIQSKRSTGSSPPQYRPEPNVMPRIPKLEITNFNTTISHLYCLHSSDEYLGCMSNTANNYTYRLPLSRFMTETDLTVRFRYWPVDSYRQPFFCANCSQCSSSFTSTRCASSSDFPSPNDVGEDITQAPPDHDFDLHGVGSWSQTAYKFRIPVYNGDSEQNPCELGPDDLGTAYYEINLIFQRICNE